MLRRNFLSGSFALAIAASRQGLAWSNQAPKSILDYGARPDGKTLNTKAIQRAVDDAYQAGGGTVHVPSGTFLTGRIDLRSHVTLYLDEGCTLRGSTSLNDYDAGDGGGEGRQRHLIFAHDAEGVTLAGPGRIDGQGKNFWEPSGKTPIPADEQWADFSSRILSPKKSGRPSPMLYFVNCRQLRIEDVRIENSSGWTLHTLNCDDVNIKGIAIKNPVVGPNTDGIDMTGCQNVLVSNCSVDTGDDAICLKSENPYGPEPRLTKNVVVTNCHLTTCCNGFKLGTSSEGGFENITFSNSVIYNDEVELKARVISGIALEVVDGGWIDGVMVSGIQMQRTRTPHLHPPRQSQAGPRLPEAGDPRREHRQRSGLGSSSRQFHHRPVRHGRAGYNALQHTRGQRASKPPGMGGPHSARKGGRVSRSQDVWNAAGFRALCPPRTRPAPEQC